MKIDLKKHRESGTFLGGLVVGGSLLAATSALSIGAVAAGAWLLIYALLLPAFYVIHKLRGRGKFFTVTHITYPSKPFPPVESAPALTETELEHNATRHLK